MYEYILVFTLPLTCAAVTLTLVPHRQAGASPVDAAQTSVTMSAEPGGTAKRVLVTGAGGRTGGIVFDKLLKKEGYATRGMVRSQKVAGHFVRIILIVIWAGLGWVGR